MASVIALYSVPYDSDAESTEQYGKSYAQMLSEDFNEDGFDDPNLLKCLGKGPSGEAVILVVPSVSARVRNNHEDALRLMVKKLNRFCSSKYSLLVCQTCTTWSDYNSYNFVNQWYDMLPKGSKKNLEKVYMVHSAYTTKTMLTCMTPFAKARVWEKIEFVDKLGDLLKRLRLDTKNMLRNFPYAVQRAEEIALGIETPLSVFGTEMWILALRVGCPFKGFPLIPPAVAHVLTKIESPEVIDTPNLLNLQCGPEVLYAAVGAYELLGEGCTVDSPETAVALFKLLVDTHVGGLIGPKAYITLKNALLQGSSNEELVQMMAKVTNEFQPVQKDCIFCIIKTLRAIARRASRNGMTVKAVSKIMAGSFFRPLSPDPYCFKAIQSSEMVLGTMIEKPDMFFKREKEPHEREEGRTKTVKHSSHTKSSSSSSAAGPRLSKSPSMRAREELQRIAQRKEAARGSASPHSVERTPTAAPAMDEEESEQITEIEE
ncbi:domain containing protein [Babesia ovata]|uniref:Domain containing protein n=1 Tax=Babesia ovata TaxID=189622 RepID=A0A2H6KEA5_9APIC|nr:domain containing protein [Babesia ovata]GBE61317.1 domain containing protein [Babesia ovata]